MRLAFTTSGPSPVPNDYLSETRWYTCEKAPVGWETRLSKCLWRGGSRAVSFPTGQWAKAFPNKECPLQVPLQMPFFPAPQSRKRVWKFIPMRPSVALTYTALGPPSSRGEAVTHCAPSGWSLQCPVMSLKSVLHLSAIKQACDLPKAISS